MNGVSVRGAQQRVLSEQLGAVEHVDGVGAACSVGGAGDIDGVVPENGRGDQISSTRQLGDLIEGLEQI